MHTDWALIIPCRGLSTFNAPLWDWCEQHTPWRSLQVVVVDSGSSNRLQSRLESIEKTTYLRIASDSFNFGAAVNAAVAVTDCKFLCILHDDVTLPDGTDWLAALHRCLEQPDVGVAVPRIMGDTPNNGQSADAPCVPWFHTSEYISSSCMAIRRDRYREMDPFGIEMSGYDWWGVDCQIRSARRGWQTVIADTTIGHVGSQTYSGRIGASLLSCDLHDLMVHNMQSVCNRNGLLCEMGMRPVDVRITVNRRRSLCLLTDGVDGLGVWLKKAGRYDEVVVVDKTGDPDVWWALLKQEHRAKFKQAPIPWKFSMAIEERPEHQIVSLAGGGRIRFVDLTGRLPETRGHRVRFGHFYALPDHCDKFTVAMAAGFGVGDNLMMTSGFAAFRRRYPHVKISAYTSGWGDVLRHNPAVDEIHIDEKLPSKAVYFGWRNATEGTSRAPYFLMGVPEELGRDPSLRYYIQPDEHEFACKLLREVGYNDEDWSGTSLDKEGIGWLVGVQMHGGWQTKNWKHVTELVEFLLRRGAYVVTFGTDGARTAELDKHERLLRIDGRTNLRQAIGVIGVLDAFVGFDSGLSYAAAAVRSPVVALFGPHHPRGLIEDAQSHNMTILRKRTPFMCFQEKGVSCRTDGGVGSNCPFRNGETGADCLDEISASEVMKELLRLPRWDRKIEERYRNAH
jgi:ADP-heptose:LPS heptosyltransferase